MARYFGIGLSKTGSKSLFKAFLNLGIEPAAHFLPPERWERIEELRFANDHPIPARFEELDNRFPDARFIYTIRDMDSWLDSCRRHWDRFRPIRSKWPEWWHTYNIEAFGVSDFDREMFRKAYIEHDEHVRDYFAGRDDFLVMDIVGGQGWQTLLQFVDLNDTKFPHQG